MFIHNFNTIIFFRPDDNQTQEVVLWAATLDDRKTWIYLLKNVMYGDIGGAIFGRDLEDLMLCEQRSADLSVPQIVDACLNFLEEHGMFTMGIFRLEIINQLINTKLIYIFSHSTAGRNKLVRELRNDFDRGLRPQLSIEVHDVSTVTTLLKQYIRELPEPLIPFVLYDYFLHIVEVFESAEGDAMRQELAFNDIVVAMNGGQVG